jgi:putative transposase
MPDHLHLFVAFDDHRANLSDWMKALKGALSANLHAAKEQSPYWQKGFFDHVLRSSDSYAEKWNYVRENPVRAGLVSRWEEWPYLGEVFPLEYRRDRV